MWTWGVGRGQGAKLVLPPPHIRHVCSGGVSRSHPRKWLTVPCLVSPSASRLVVRFVKGAFGDALASPPGMFLLWVREWGGPLPATRVVCVNDPMQPRAPKWRLRPCFSHGRFNHRHYCARLVLSLLTWTGLPDDPPPPPPSWAAEVTSVHVLRTAAAPPAHRVVFCVSPACLAYLSGVLLLTV